MALIVALLVAGVGVFAWWYRRNHSGDSGQVPAPAGTAPPGQDPMPEAAEAEPTGPEVDPADGEPAQAQAPIEESPQSDAADRIETDGPGKQAPPTT